MGAQQQGADATDGRWLSLVLTLCFITHGADVLLRRRGDHRRVFPGMYNGLGGHVEQGEDPYSSAIREIREESGLSVTSLRLRGISTIDAGGLTGITMFIFTANATSRMLIESDEGTLHWVPLASTHDLPLVEDLPILLARLFAADAHADEPFFAHVSYDANDRLLMTFTDAV